MFVVGVLFIFDPNQVGIEISRSHPSTAGDAEKRNRQADAEIII